MEVDSDNGPLTLFASGATVEKYVQWPGRLYMDIKT
jgi:hypothetical protein